MEQNKSVKIAFWRGLVLGPLAVVPATILAAMFSVAFQVDSQSIGKTLQTSLIISIWGVSIAYVLVASFGAFTWYILWRLQCLSLVSLLACSLIPSALIVISTSDIVISLIVAYYSMAVCYMCWFVGLRNVQKV